MYNPDDCVIFGEKITNEPFCACVFGTFSTTQIDEHGHQIDSTVFERSLEQMSQKPQHRLVTVHHDSKKQIGEILWAGIRDDDQSVTHLIGGIGVYERERDRLEEIESGVLGGFSVEYVDFLNCGEDEWYPSRSNFEYHGPGENYHRFKALLDHKNISARIELGKSASGELLVEVIIENWQDILDLGIYAWGFYQWKKNKSEDEDEIEREETTIQVNNTKVILTDFNEDQYIELLSRAAGFEMNDEQKENLKQEIDTAKNVIAENEKETQTNLVEES